MHTSGDSKRIAKNTVMLYIRMLFMMAISLYTSRVILQTLGVVDYGIYNVVWGVATMFSFLNAALSSSTQRYLTFELGGGNSSRLRDVFCTSVNLHAALSVVIALLIETVGLWFLYNKLSIPPERFQAAVVTFHLSVVTTVILVMNVPYMAAIIAHEKMQAFAYLSVLEVVLKLAIVYLLLISPIDKLILYVTLYTIVQGSVNLIYRWYCVRNFEETKYRFILKKKLFKEMLGFSGWNLFGNLAAAGFSQGVDILLNLFFGPTVNAARGIANQVQGAVRQFSGNFQVALNPQITKSYASGEMDYMHRLIFASSKYSFYLLWFLSLPLMLEIQQVLSWWLTTVPAHTAAFVVFMLLIGMIDALANPLIQGASATGHVRKYQATLGTLLLLIVPFSYVALKLGCPPEGVLVVHLVVAVFTQCVRLLLLRPMISFSIRAYARQAVVPIVVVGVVSLICPAAVRLSMPEGFVRFLCVCLCSVLSTGLCIYFLGLTSGERTMINGKLRSLLKRAV